MLKNYFEYFSYAVMGVVILLIILLYSHIIPVQYYTFVIIFCIALILVRFILRFYLHIKEKKTE